MRNIENILDQIRHQLRRRHHNGVSWNDRGNGVTLTYEQLTGLNYPAPIKNQDIKLTCSEAESLIEFVNKENRIIN